MSFEPPVASKMKGMTRATVTVVESMFGSDTGDECAASDDETEDVGVVVEHHIARDICVELAASVRHDA